MILSDLKRFILFLTISLLLCFIAQAWIYHFLHVGFWEAGILWNYLFNYLITLGAFVLLSPKLKNTPSKSGRIFLVTSLVKFLLFFILIYPTLETNHSVRSPAFFSFFIPYAVCTFLEITSIIRLLNGK